MACSIYYKPVNEAAGRTRRQRGVLADHEDPRLQRQSAARRSDFRLSRPAAHQSQRAALLGSGGVCRDSRERARRRRLRDPADFVPGERQFDGIAGRARRAETRLGAPGHRCRALLRLRPARSKIRLAHPDLCQARRQYDHHRRRRSGPHPRSPFRSDPGLLRHPDR